MRTLRSHLIFLIVSFTICSHGWTGEKQDAGPQKSLDPRLNITTAVNLALERAKVERANEAKEFFARMTEFDAMSRRWNVIFQGRETRLDFENCFRIFVDDATSAIEYRGCP
jgi:hypothetical protein